MLAIIFFSINPFYNWSITKMLMYQDEGIKKIQNKIPFINRV